MAGMSRLRRSIRCHLKHGTRCPHIERHSLRRPRGRRKRLDTATEPLTEPLNEPLHGRHIAH